MLAVLVAATSCGGEEPASDGDDDQAQELGQLPEPEDAQESEEAQDQAERPAASLWPHCADYGALLEAITRAESAEPAIEDAQIALEEAGAALSRG